MSVAVVRRGRSTLFALCAWSPILVALVTGSVLGQSIVTIAGSSLIDDGRAATDAGLRYPTAASFDSAGNLFIADSNNNRIRRVDAKTQRITTVVGAGLAGFSGDGDLATEAELHTPTAVAVDAKGNVLVVDAGNNRVRRIDASTGVIVTVAGGGNSGLGDGGPAISAELSFALFLDLPSGIALDTSQNVYIADTGHHRVRRLYAATGVITTVAGSGASGSDGNGTYSGDGGSAILAGLAQPTAIAIDATNALYIADTHNHRIRQVAGGMITTVAGSGVAGFTGDGGQASSASLWRPLGVAIAADGTIYISDSENRRIRKVAAGIITTIAGDGSIGAPGDGGAARNAHVSHPEGLAVGTNQNLVIADAHDYRVRAISLGNGTITTIAGNGTGGAVGDNGPATSAVLFSPFYVALDPHGNVIFSDRENQRIREVDRLTGIITTVVGNGTGGFVGTFSGDGGPATAAGVNRPLGVTVDRAGNIFFSDTQNQRVRMVDAKSQMISTIAGTGESGYSGDGGPAANARISFPRGLSVDAANNIYFADTVNGVIRKVTGDTRVITTVVCCLNAPTDVQVAPDGDLIIAEPGLNRVRRYSAGSGSLANLAGTGAPGLSGDGATAVNAMLNNPNGVAIDATGNVYIADTGNRRIRRVAAGTGIISTVAGGGNSGFRDGGPAIGAELGEPFNAVVSPNGDLFLPDTSSNRIRAVFGCRPIGIPVVDAPADSSTNIPILPTLSWQSVKDAFRYDIYLSTANPPSLIASDLTSTVFAPSNLSAGVTYFWRVVAKADQFCPSQSIATSETRSFTTLAGCTAPGGFDLTQPANGTSSVGSSAQLSWQSASGAATYDVYFGSSNPPPLFTKGVSVTTQDVSGLTSSTTYYWYVVAHATCDATKTTLSPTRSFQTTGGCAGAGPFSLNSPSNGAVGVSTTTTLDWSSSSNASSYDVYLGTSSPPPLYLVDVSKPRIGVSGLTLSTTYYWRVVAKVACDPTKNLSSPTSNFTTAGVCTTPGATSIIFVPPGNIGVGQTYTVAWQELPELGRDSYYVVERSTSSSFATILDSQQSFSTSASFISSTAGTYYHRVRAVPGCDPSHPGPVSAVKGVNVVTGTANVIFTVQPKAVITAVGDKLEDKKARFTLENLGNSPLPVLVSAFQDPTFTFFSWRDPLGGNSGRFTLESRTPKSFDIEFHGPPNSVSGVYQGLIVVNAEGRALAITPYAFVSLKVGGGVTSRPAYLTNGVPTEYTFFPGFAGSEDANRPPIKVDIRNDGTAPMELGAEIGPEVWLVPEKDWNATPIPAGASRSIRLTTHRYSAPSGSALPRYTYFTVRSKNGETARLLVQDNDALPTSFGRASLLDPGSRSFIVPGVVSAPPQFSRVRITNVGSDPVQTDLFFTPAGSDGFNASAVKRATIVIPPNDVVTLTDPLVQVFGLSAPAQGQIEVRADPAKIGFLIVSSSVFTPLTTGGSYSYEMPTLLLGEGARLGTSQVIVGVGANASTRASLTLVETSGTEPTRVRAILFDAQGARKGDRLVDVARYGQTRIDNVVTALGGSEPVDGCRIELDVESGGGSVAGVVTMLDATRNNGASLVSQPTTGTVSGAAYARLRRAKIGAAGVSVSAVAPVVLNGPSSTGPSQRTTMGFAATPGSSKTAVVTYRPSGPAASPIDKMLQLPSGTVLQFENVLEDLFGIPKGQTASGSVFIQADAGFEIYARLATLTGTTWTVSSGLPIVATLSDALSSLSSKHPLYLDGLEQSVDATRGTRWAVDINEIGGASGTVLVGLYEAGNRSVAIMEKRYNIGAYQQLKLDTVFAALELDSDDRRKDRTNVMCRVSADSGNAVISAVGMSTDSRTGDTRTFVFSPTGGVPSTGVLRITTVAPVLPPESSTGRRRAVHP